MKTRCVAALLSLFVLVGCSAGKASQEPLTQPPAVEVSESEGDEAAPDERTSEPEADSLDGQQDDGDSSAAVENGRNQYTEKRDDYIIDSPFERDGEWYLLQSAADLRLLRELIDQQAAFSDGTKAKTAKYRLTADIDLTDELHPELGWIPIGSYILSQQRTSRQYTSFSGEFDGGMHTISGLVIHAPELHEPLGLFGHVSNGTIRNVVIEDCSIIGLSSVGAVAGKSLVSNSNEQALIANCVVSGSVTGSSFVGGIAGNANEVLNCGFTGTVTGLPDTLFDQTSYGVGGIAGESIRLSGCYAKGEASGYRYVGGLTGSGRRVFNSYFIGTVDGVETVGGAAGSLPVVQGCYTVADVSGHEGVGGVVGHIADTYNTEPETIQATALNLLAAGKSVRKTENPPDRDQSFDWPLGRVLGSVGAGIGADNIYGLESMDTNTIGRSLSYYWDGDHFPDRYLPDLSAWPEILTPDGGWGEIWKQQEGCYPQLAWETGDAQPIDP